MIYPLSEPSSQVCEDSCQLSEERASQSIIPERGIDQIFPICQVAKPTALVTIQQGLA